MKLDYAKAFQGIFKNSDLKSTFLVTIAITIIASILKTFTGKEFDIPQYAKLLSLGGYLALTVLTSGYYLQIMHNEINNKANSLPDYKNKIGKYLQNGLMFTLLVILAVIAILIVSIPLFVGVGFIIGSFATAEASSKITMVTILGFVLLSYLILIGLFLNVITAKFAKNFKFSEALAPIKALKFLYKNIVSYLKVVGIAILGFIISIIITAVAGSILGFVLIITIKNANLNTKPLLEILGIIIASPFITYITIVTSNLYAQIYKLGSIQPLQEAEIQEI